MPAALAPTNREPPTELGRRIHAWRREKALNRTEAAERIGVSKDAIYNWEVRGTVPHHRRIRSRLIELGFLPEEAISWPVQTDPKLFQKPRTAGKTRPWKEVSNRLAS